MLADEADMNPELVIVPVIIGLCMMPLSCWLGRFSAREFQMGQRRKEDVWVSVRKAFRNLANICFRPSVLTREELGARKWLFVCLCGAPLGVALVLVLGAVRAHL
jgi:hypothetical protein